ncbi:MAG: DHH family phosphoesterase [Candidatus Bathyarchaeia archaeon]
MRGQASLVRLLRKSRSALVVGHQNSDPDAVCSAYAFMALANKINPKLQLTFTSPDGVSKLSKQILHLVPLEVDESPRLDSVDLIVTVDTNTLQQLGKLKEEVLHSAKPLVMIDHHAPHPENTKTAALVLCDEHSTSTCEMVLEMYEEMGVKLNPTVSQALLLGVLVETGHMTIGTRRTFKNAYTLVSAGADPQEAIAATRPTMDDSERFARIKSAQRVRMERVGKWLVASSEVGSYHASAARGLVALGAHLAIVAGKRDGDLTVSLRSTREFVTETGMHLGSDLANPLGLRMGGMGGGHATAAGAQVKGEANEALKNALSLVREFLSRSPKPNTADTGNAEASSQTRVITQK